MIEDGQYQLAFYTRVVNINQKMEKDVEKPDTCISNKTENITIR